MNENNNIKEILDNMNAEQAVDYFKNENVTLKTSIIQNMSVDQIVELLKSNKPEDRGINQGKLYLNKLDNNKLVDVINRLGEEELRDIFVPTNRSNDFVEGRREIIEKLKNNGLTEETINKLRNIGYHDFDNEISNSNTENNPGPTIPTPDPIVIPEPTSTPIPTNNVPTNTSLNISDATREKNNMKKAYDRFEKSLGEENEMFLYDLNQINMDQFDRFMEQIDVLANTEIDKCDLDKRTSFYVSLNNLNKKVNNKKKQIESRKASLQKEQSQVDKYIARIGTRISNLKIKIPRIKDPEEKAKCEQELISYQALLDDLIDRKNYVNIGEKYFQRPSFTAKGKPISQVINAPISDKQRQAMSTRRANQGPAQSTPSGPTQSAPNGPAQSTPGGPAQNPPGGPAQSTPGGPAQNPPGGPAQNPPGGPAQSTPSGPAQPSVVDKSIRYYVENGTLPKNIIDNDYITLANDLSIPANDMDYVLSDNELERLKTSKKVMLAVTNLDVTKKHKESIDDYDQLIQKYEDILATMGDYQHSQKEEDFIKDILADLKSKSKNYSDKVQSLGLESASDYVTFEKDKKNRKIDSISKKLDKNEEILKAKYKELEKEEKNLKNPKFKNMKGAINKNIRKLNAEIKALQGKQIELNSTQTMIINANTNKYITRVKEKQQRS